jgi:hypothetical protein
MLGEVGAELGESELEPLGEPALVDLHMLFLQLVHLDVSSGRGLPGNEAFALELVP